MSEYSEKMGMAVGNYFKHGYNCAEAIVEAFRIEGGVHIDDNAFRLCSGLGGGMGHARDVCGALVGCIMVISTLVGRNKPNEKPLKEIYPYTKDFHDRFVKAFGSSACKDLMHFEFDTREHLVGCLKLSNKIGQLLAEFLEEKKLVPGSNL
jgi:C_GCAxxG_C_C family probable redox protein